MSSVDCQQCRRILEYSGDRPSYCAYCGVRLEDRTLRWGESNQEGSTVAYQGPTAVPESDRSATGPIVSIRGYQIRRWLGSGGMGTVYEARDVSSEQLVAIKVLNQQYSAHSVSLDRFRQEGQLASLIAHPRCVFVHSTDESLGRPYIVMELMPGRTLRDLVAQDGPLAPDDAVRKILDVIEGLREAHRLEILHRDVKPSNCFLLPDGRVKIGDFGLAKSLEGDGQLTQTGAFLGTILYAAPEQVRAENIGYATDIYAVSATLYFLLTGKAPFEHDNPGKVLARLMSEPPPSIRKLRPEVSKRLDRIILKGLQRDPAHRWKSLSALQTALQSLLPEGITRASPGMRLAAYLIDAIVIFVSSALLMLLMRFAIADWFADHSWLGDRVALLLEFGYFLLLEGVYGASIGKRCVRLRVCDQLSTQFLDRRSIVLRTGVFVLLLHMHAIVEWLFDPPGGLSALMQIGALMLLVAPMRAANGYRGLHEWASRSRVVQIPWEIKRRPIQPRQRQATTRFVVPERFPRTIGPYSLRSTIFSDANQAVVLAEDPLLKRMVHLWVQPVSAPPLSLARKQVTRATRARWIGSGETDGWCWNAFFAPDGASLPEVVHPRRPLYWTETRKILEQLAHEIREGQQDGTLPPLVSLNQVWVLPDGRVELLEFIPGKGLPRVEDGKSAAAYLRDVAVTCLEGASRPIETSDSGIRAPVPRHASELLAPLLHQNADPLDLDQFTQQLKETEPLPSETTRAQRSAHLGVQAIFLSLGIVWMFTFAGLFGILDLGFSWLKLQQGQFALSVVSQKNLPKDIAALVEQYNADGQLAQRIRTQNERLRLAIQKRFATANVGERLIFQIIRNHPNEKYPLDPKFIGSQFALAMEDFALPESDFRTEFQKYHSIFLAALVFFPVVWILWAFLTRGGLTLSLMGLGLSQTNGRRAARWRCAVRSLLVWLPLVVMLWLCMVIKVEYPQLFLVHSACWWFALAILLIELTLGFLHPQRSWHDWVMGTYLVPH